MPKPIDPSPTPWDHSTWGFYCDFCEKFFDLLRDGKVLTHKGNTCSYEHKCGQPARYIGYDHDAVKPTIETGMLQPGEKAIMPAQNPSARKPKGETR